MRFLTLISVIFVFFPLFTVAHDVDTEASAMVIHMTGKGFSPEEVTISQGETVIFENADARLRWPASNIHPTHSLYPESGIQKCGSNEQELIFDSCKGLAPGEAYAFMFNHEGVWRFHDHLRPSFSGEIIVKKRGSFERKSKDVGNVKNALSQFMQDISAFGTKTLYGLVPGKREQKLKELHFNDIAFEDAKLRYWMLVFGPEVVFDELALDAKSANYPGCHLPAHLVGRMAYTLFNISPLEVFDDRCQFGYYHGLLESFLGEEGQEDIVYSMAERCDSFNSFSEKVKCYHGIGHGLTVFYNYDLPKALSECFSLAFSGFEEYCHGGVFMENAFAGIDFAVSDSHDSEWIHDDDPYFPCNALGDNYSVLEQCYYMQPFTMLDIFDQDFDRVIDACTQLSQGFAKSCFRGIGFFVAAPPETPNLDTALSVCERVSEQNDYRKQCVLGISEVLSFVWGEELRSTAETVCRHFGGDIETECMILLDSVLPL